MFLPRTRTKCRRQGDRSNPPTRVWASVVFLLCMCLLLVVPCVESRQPRTTVFLRRQSLSASQVVPRGGALPGSRVPVTPQNNNLPYGQPQSSPSTTFHSPNPTQENTKDMIDAFLTRDSRNSFIARVYAILSVQLLVTAGSCVLFGLNPNIARSMYVRGSPAAAVPTLSLVLSTVAWFMMCANPDNRRKAPMKWNLLALFTIGEAISVGFISSFYRFASVVQAMVATGIATLAVSAYTILQNNPNRDLSQMGASLSTCAVIFLVYGLVGLLTKIGWLPAGLIPFSDMLYGMFGAVLFSFFLAYHTKLIVGGKHAKYQLNEKDYVFGACALYNDIINIFIYVLRLIGEDKD